MKRGSLRFRTVFEGEPPIQTPSSVLVSAGAQATGRFSTQNCPQAKVCSRTIAHPNPPKNPNQPQGSNPIRCVWCFSNNHEVFQCPEFAPFSNEERGILVDWQRRCRNCLSDKHWAHHCKDHHRCSRCGGSHHVMIHLTPISLFPGALPRQNSTHARRCRRKRANQLRKSEALKKSSVLASSNVVSKTLNQPTSSSVHVESYGDPSLIEPPSRSVSPTLSASHGSPPRKTSPQRKCSHRLKSEKKKAPSDVANDSHSDLSSQLPQPLSNSETLRPNNLSLQLPQPVSNSDTSESNNLSLQPPQRFSRSVTWESNDLSLQLSQPSSNSDSLGSNALFLQLLQLHSNSETMGSNDLLSQLPQLFSSSDPLKSNDLLSQLPQPLSFSDLLRYSDIFLQLLKVLSNAETVGSNDLLSQLPQLFPSSDPLKSKDLLSQLPQPLSISDLLRSSDIFLQLLQLLCNSYPLRSNDLFLQSPQRLFDGDSWRSQLPQPVSNSDTSGSNDLFLQLSQPVSAPPPICDQLVQLPCKGNGKQACGDQRPSGSSSITLSASKVSSIKVASSESCNPQPLKSEISNPSPGLDVEYSRFLQSLQPVSDFQIEELPRSKHDQVCDDLRPSCSFSSVSSAPNGSSSRHTPPLGDSCSQPPASRASAPEPDMIDSCDLDSSRLREFFLQSVPLHCPPPPIRYQGVQLPCNSKRREVCDNLSPDATLFPIQAVESPETPAAKVSHDSSLIVEHPKRQRLPFSAPVDPDSLLDLSLPKRSRFEKK